MRAEYCGSERASNQTVLSAMGLAVILNVIVQGAAPQLVSLFLSKSDPLYMQTLHVAAADVRVITLGIFIMAPMYLYRIAIQTLGHPQYPMYAGFLQLAARVFAVTVLPPLIGEYAYYLSTVLAWAVTLPVVVIPFYKIHQNSGKNRNAGSGALRLSAAASFVFFLLFDRTFPIMEA